MAPVTYALEELAHDMEELIRQRPDQAKIFDAGSSYLKRLISDPDAIPQEYRVPSGRGRRPNHGSYLVYRGDSGLLITAVVWGPGDHASPHDHHTWGMIGVANNALTETRFRRLDDGSDPEYALLEKDRVSTFRSGEISLLVPGVDEIHQMDNPSDRPTVEIHVYGRELVGLNRCRFDPGTGKVSPFVTMGYDNE